MLRKQIKVGRDHVQSLVASSPQRAIEELIWNGLDAGGPTVDVILTEGDLRAIRRVEVIDRGPGIRHDQLDTAFESIGNSTKPRLQTNPDGRPYHGRQGKGRLKALALAPNARWETTYIENGKLLTYTIAIRRDDPDFFEVSEPKPATTNHTGTRLILEDIDKGTLALGSDDMRLRLAETFAAYLTRYPGTSVIYHGRPLLIDELIEHRHEIPVLPEGHPAGPATMLVIEWRFKPEGRRLHICDLGGFSCHEVAANVRGHGIDYTAYLRTPAAREWAQSGRFAAGDLDEVTQPVINLAKELLRAHLRERRAAVAYSLVAEWKRQDIYPFHEEPLDPLARAEREIFDIVALQVNDSHPTFVKADSDNKRLTLALIRQALESNPAGLTKILRSVIDLSEEDQRAFADLLERTPLTNLIRAGQIVTERLDTVGVFSHILFDEPWREQLLERTQLHRLLAHELWILGEAFTLATDDESLRAVLEKHLHILGAERKSLAPNVDVKLINGKDGIPDLMLWHQGKVDHDKYEHLVIELKRPSELLRRPEVGQIEEYAITVARDERFNTQNVRWRFVLLGNDLDPYAIERSTADNLPPGCIHSKGNVSIWVQRWADVLTAAKLRYEFFREKLKVEASLDLGMGRFKDEYEHLINGRGVRKAKDLDIMEKKKHAH